MTGDSAGTRGVSTDYRYLPVGRFFLNAQLGLPRAWRLLWQQQSDFLGSEGKRLGRDDDGGDLPRKVVATAKLMLTYLYRRFGASDEPLRLPVSGDLAIKRLSGAIKLLDLEGRKVYTVMRYESAGNKLAERIESARRVASFPFAPRFEGADLEAGWLAEEHIPGVHPTGFRGCRERFDDYYLGLLVDILLADEPVEANFSDYVTSLYEDVMAPRGLLERVEPTLRSDISSFVESLKDRLLGSRFAGGSIPLTLSHGDFFSGNVILTPGGQPRAIDWATTGTRSPLYDLYYLVMNHCVRVMPPVERRDRFGQMLAAVRERLGAKSPAKLAALESGLSEATELRLLFYLESVHVPLMHCDDPKDRYITSLATRIEWYQDFERALEDGKVRLGATDEREQPDPPSAGGNRGG